VTPGRFSSRTAWVGRFTPLRRFVRTETGGAALLVAAVLAGLAWANIGGSYQQVWETHLAVTLGDESIHLSLREWVNSGLMTFFFAVVGLEARREYDLGELRERRRLVLPLLAYWTPPRPGRSKVRVRRTVAHGDVRHALVDVGGSRRCFGAIWREIVGRCATLRAGSVWVRMLALALAASAACGPVHAQTLARDAEARVYSRAGAVFACDGHVTAALGPRSRFIAAQLAGRRLALRRRMSPGREQLTTYDLRRGHLRERVNLAGTFAAVRVNRLGTAVYVARPASRPAFIRTARGLWGEQAPNVDPASLVLAGATIAWRAGGEAIQVRQLDFFKSRKTIPFLRVGDVRLTMRASVLYAQVGGSPARKLGYGLGQCESSSGCAGVAMVQAAGRFLAVGEASIDFDGDRRALAVRDLQRGTTRTACDPGRSATYFWGTYGALVLTDRGAIACGMTVRGIPRIQSENTVLDEGAGLDSETLVRRGDQLVWTHNGVERTAPLPE
jgi:hypothetical protein